MALHVPHSIFHLARLLYVRPETFGTYYVYPVQNMSVSPFHCSEFVMYYVYYKTRVYFMHNS